MARRTGSTSMDLGPRLWLAAFGKHPGWNDHIDDLGVETDRLVAAKRAIYTEGIGGIIDSGAWEKLEGAQRVDGFDHSFLWRSIDGVVAGRIWSSTDGKGRSKYPMILMVHCDALPLRFITERVMPRLAQLEDECRAAESAATVISVVDAARSELRRLAESSSRVLTDPLPPPAAVTTIADREALGPEREGLYRVLYQLERDFGSYRTPTRGESGTGSRTMDTRPQQMRVPRVSATIGEEWNLWLRLMVSQLDPMSPVLCITGEGRGWTDLIAGEPASAQLQCLQAGEEAFPLTTSIPYTIDKDFKARCDELIEVGAKGGVVEHDPAYMAVSADRLAQLARGAVARPSSPGGGGKPTGVIVAAVVAALVLAGIVAVVLVMRGNAAGGASDAAQEQETQEQADAEPPPGWPSAADEPVIAAFERWCAASDRWVSGFVQRVDELESAGDPHLIALGERIRAGVDGGGPDSLSPTSVWDEPVRTRTNEQLAEQVRVGQHRDVFRRAATRERVLAAVGAVDEIDAMAGPDGWPAAAAIERVVPLVGAAGARETASRLSGLLERLVAGNGRERIESAVAIASVGGDAERVAAALADIESGRAAADVSGDAVLAGFGAAADAALARSFGGVEGAGALGTAADRLQTAASASRELAAFIEDGWQQVDRGAFEADSASHRRGELDGVAGVRAWLAEASDARFRLLDPALDPRRDPATRRAIAGGLDGVVARLAELEEQWADDATIRARVAALRGRAEGARGDWDDLGALAWRTETRDPVEAGVAALRSESAEVRRALTELNGELAASAEEYVAGLPDEVSRRGFASVDAAWASGKAGIAERVRGGAEYAQVRAAVDALRTGLDGVESEAVEPEWPRDTVRVDVAGLRSAWRLSADAALAEAIAAAGWDGAGFVDAQGSGVTAVLAALAGRGEELSDLAADLTLLDVALDEGLGLDEVIGSRGETGAELVERVRSMGSLGDPVVAGAVGASLDIVDEVERVGVSDDPAELIVAGETRPFPVAVAAWARLGEVNLGPSEAGLVSNAASVAERLRAEAAVIGRPARARALVAQIDQAGRDLWLRAAQGAQAREDLAGLVALMPAFEVDAGTLPAGLRYDALILGMLGRIEAARAGDEGDAAVRAMVTQAWAGIAAAGDQAGVGRETDAAVRALLAEPAGSGPALDVSSVGPGRVGWTGEIDGDGRIVYRSPDAGAELAFRVVEPDDGAPAMLGEREVSVGLVARAFAGDARVRDGIAALLLEDWGDGQDPRVGPRSWVWDASGWIEPPSRWLREGSEDVAPAFAGDEGPGASTPVNWVSRVAALGIARSLGCRLPTPAEWAAAYAQLGVPVASSGWNVRDGSFAVQRDHAAALESAGKIVEWPDEGVFALSSESAPRGRLAEALDTDDGDLWFAPVDAGAGADHGWAHLVGNVAEYVAEYAGESDLARGDVGDGPPSTDADQLRSLVRDGGVTVSVIGGSALSPPSVPVNVRREMPRRVRAAGYSDVGIRLAFDLGGQGLRVTLASRVAGVLKGAELATVAPGD
jgi:hypothetical protein